MKENKYDHLKNFFMMLMLFFGVILIVLTENPKWIYLAIIAGFFMTVFQTLSIWYDKNNK